MTFSKFLQHDMMHGIFHLDKGILYTLKSLIYKPGYAAKKFIAGKRVSHYNIFALFIIIVTLKTLVDLQRSPGSLFTSYSDPAKHSDEIINETVHHYYKLFYLLVIPLLSVFSRMFIKKLNYNFIEHLVLNCFILAGGFFYALITSLLCSITHTRIGLFNFIVITVYILIGYYQACKDDYTFFGYLWRVLCIITLFVLSLLLILVTVINIFYNGMFEGRMAF